MSQNSFILTDDTS